MTVYSTFLSISECIREKVEYTFYSLYHVIHSITREHTEKHFRRTWFTCHKKYRFPFEDLTATFARFKLFAGTNERKRSVSSTSDSSISHDFCLRQFFVSYSNVLARTEHAVYSEIKKAVRTREINFNSLHLTLSKETAAWRWEFWTWTTPRLRTRRHRCWHRAPTFPRRLCALPPPTRTTLVSRTTKLRRCRRDAAAVATLPLRTFASVFMWGIYRSGRPSRSFCSIKVTNFNSSLLSGDPIFSIKYHSNWILLM